MFCACLGLNTARRSMHCHSLFLLLLPCGKLFARIKWRWHNGWWVGVACCLTSRRSAWSLLVLPMSAWGKPIRNMFLQSSWWFTPWNVSVSRNSGLNDCGEGWVRSVATTHRLVMILANLNGADSVQMWIVAEIGQKKKCVQALVRKHQRKWMDGN